MEPQKDPKNWFEIGLANLRLKYYRRDRPAEQDERLEEAVACFDKATDLKPDYAEAWFYKGLALAESGHDPSAVAAYEEALRLSPDHLEAWRRSEAHSWFGRGLVELQRPDADSISERDNQLEDAVDCFDRATVLKPDYAEAWFYKGAALAELWGDLSSAAYEEALRLKPDHAEAWGRLATKCSVSAASCFAEVEDRVGDVLKAQGDLPAALQSYKDSLAIRERLAERGPSECQRDLPVSYDNVGDVLKEQGDLPAALQSYKDSLAIRERLAEKDPDNAQWQRDLAISHGRVAMVLAQQDEAVRAADKFQEGRRIIARLMEQSPDDATLPKDLAWFDGEIAKLE